MDPGPRVPGLRDPGPGAQGGLGDPGPGTQGPDLNTGDLWRGLGEGFRLPGRLTRDSQVVSLVIDSRVSGLKSVF